VGDHLFPGKRNARVKPSELRGSEPTNAWPKPGHAPGKHQAENEAVANIINNAERRFIGVGENGRSVNVFVQNGNAVITEGNDVTRIVTTYGKDFVNKLPGGRVVPGKPVDARYIRDHWENNFFSEVH